MTYPGVGAAGALFSIDPDIPFIFSGAKEFHGINVIAKWYKNKIVFWRNYEQK